MADVAAQAAGRSVSAYMFFLAWQRGRGWRGLMFRALRGLRRRVWLSQIARYSAVCFPLPPVTVYLTRLTRRPLKGRPCSTSSVRPLLGYAECRAQMCLQWRILGEIISSLSDLLLPYTPALGSGSH